MKRALLVALALLAGIAGGAAATAAIQRGDDPPPTSARAVVPVVSATIPVPPPVTGPQVLLAWAQGGLPPAAIDAARAVPGVEAVAVVRDGRTDLALDDGWRIPLDTIAVDPAEYAEVVPAADRAAVLGLGPGAALLGETSAGLRGLVAGDDLALVGGTTLRVAGVVPDSSVGAAEVVVDVATGEGLGVRTARAVLVAHDGDRAAVEAAVAGAAGGSPVRFRAPGETPYLRAADAVLPQSIVKAAFGEFSYRPGGGGDDDAITVDPAWVAANVVEVDVPGVGPVRCHRAAIDGIVSVLTELGAPAGYDGCFVPRTVRSGQSLSRHSWGIAIDLGFGDNPTRAGSAQDPALVAAFEAAGFTWGGNWLVPDPAHFELVRPVSPAPPRPPG